MDDTTMEAPAKRGPGRPPKAAVNDEQPEARPATMLAVKLLKHYRPRGEFEVLERAPPPLPGVTGVTKAKDKNGEFVAVGEKLWAGTVVKLPRDEGVALLDNHAVSQEPVLGPDGKSQRNAAGDVIRRTVRTKFPLAERADPLPV